jgi:4-hydroxybenzoate polyprenyltransferase
MRIAAVIIRAMRPKQWVKNLLLFAGLVFSHHVASAPRVLAALAGFAIFCLLSGMVYLVNDIRDLENDRKHPLKCRRPIASGELSAAAAAAVAAIAGVGALAWAFLINWQFGLCAALYAGLMLAYSIWLKHVVILDLLIVAFGFVIRAIAGVKVIQFAGEEIPITPWFKLCILSLALFLVICKRRHELLLLTGNAAGHRPVLEHYSQAFLDQLVSVATSATLISYALYVSLGVAGTPNAEYMVYTLPFVLYGIFRYLYLVYKREEGGAPESTFFQDPALLANVALWMIAVVLLYK